MLRLEAVSAGYDGHTVLRDVSLAVPAGCVVALLGPNGAGKTTLLRVASGLLRPSSGALRLDGANVTGWRPSRLARAGICHIPEGRGVFPTLTVRDNLRLQCPPTAEPDALERVLEDFPRLGERRSQVAGSMSGGEQQMLALAHAYISHPRLVLLDEVSMGLAPKVVDEVFGYLHRLAQGGAALLLVEQYVSRALEMADYVYVLNRGRVVFVGEPSELTHGNIAAKYLGDLVS